RLEHEMIDEELRAYPDKIREGCFSFIGLESVILVDSNPGQFLPPPSQLVAAPRQFLLGLEQLPPGRQPLITCSGLMLNHRFLFFHLVGHRLFVYFAGGWVVFVARISATQDFG